MKPLNAAQIIAAFRDGKITREKAVEAVKDLVAAEKEKCAVIAENVTDGYSANIRISLDEQEFLKDKDGPWVLNSDVAKAIRRSR